MKKRLSKIVLGVTVVSTSLISGLSTINATSYIYECSSKGKTFTKAWSVTKLDSSYETFKYGYNTTLINEDYVHTYHETKYHTSYVKNSKAAASKSKKAGKYAKAEITHHSGGTIYYRYSY